MPRSSAPGDALQFGDCPLAGELGRTESRRRRLGAEVAQQRLVGNPCAAQTRTVRREWRWSGRLAPTDWRRAVFVVLGVLASVLEAPFKSDLGHVDRLREG